MMDSSPSKPHVIRREACSRCRAGGGDRAGDNVAVYSDGSSHCFGCGAHGFPTTWERLTQLVKHSDSTGMTTEHGLDFPRDYAPIEDALWAKPGLQWLRSYGLTNDEIRNARIGWSMSRNLLIFPVYNANNQLVMWQGRNFSGEGNKYLTYGEKRDIMHLVGKSASSIVVATEDLVSAIKVGRKYQALPLFGAELSLGLIQSLSARFDMLGIWLDSNKLKESVKHALRASQYVPTFVVSTEYDPKHYSYDAMVDRVEAAMQEATYQGEAYEDPKIEAEPLKEEAADRLRRAVAGFLAKKSVMDNVGAQVGITKHFVAPCKECGVSGVRNTCFMYRDNCPWFPGQVSKGAAMTVVPDGTRIIRETAFTIKAPVQPTTYSDPHADMRGKEDRELYGGISPETTIFPGCGAGASCYSTDGKECSACKEFDESKSLPVEEDNFGRTLFKDAWPFHPTGDSKQVQVHQYDYKKGASGS